MPPRATNPRSCGLCSTTYVLTTGQILVVGGVDAAGVPVAALELFTPDPAGAFTAGAVACGR